MATAAGREESPPPPHNNPPHSPDEQATLELTRETDASHGIMSGSSKGQKNTESRARACGPVALSWLVVNLQATGTNAGSAGKK
jgi:hypothetical protein